MDTFLYLFSNRWKASELLTPIFRKNMVEKQIVDAINDKIQKEQNEVDLGEKNQSNSIEQIEKTKNKLKNANELGLKKDMKNLEKQSPSTNDINQNDEIISTSFKVGMQDGLWKQNPGQTNKKDVNLDVDTKLADKFASKMALDLEADEKYSYSIDKISEILDLEDGKGVKKGTIKIF